MEARVTEIGRELKRYGIDKTDAPVMTGDYGEDRHAVREYYIIMWSLNKFWRCEVCVLYI